MILKRLWSVPIVVGMALALAACSDDQENAGTTAPPGGSPVLGEIQKQPDVVQELDEAYTVAFDGLIKVEVKDIKFAPNKLTLQVGDSITIRVINADTPDHNLRIAGLDGQWVTDDDAVTLPDTIAAGESGELNFAPLIPGNYTFRCDFHPGSMGGQVVVRPGPQS